MVCLHLPFLVDFSIYGSSYPTQRCASATCLAKQNGFLFFQSKQAHRRNVIKFKTLMKYLILHHFLCFYLVSKAEPIYIQRLWNIGLGGPKSTNKREALSQHISYKKAKAKFKRNSCANKVMWCGFSQEPGATTAVGKGTLGIASLVQG